MKFTKMIPVLITSSIFATSLLTAQTNTQPSIQQMDTDTLFERQVQRMQHMQEEIDRMFEEFDKDFYNASLHSIPKHPIMRHATVTSSQLKDKGTHYEISIMRPKDSNVNITTKNHRLTIQITQTRNSEKKNQYGQMVSYANSSTIQSFSLPFDADTAAMDTKEDEEYLIISIPKISSKNTSAIQPAQTESNATVQPVKQPENNTSKIPDRNNQALPKASAPVI